MTHAGDKQSFGPDASGFLDLLKSLVTVSGGHFDISEIRIASVATGTTPPTIKSGTAVPTAAEPNGSIYLRQGAGADLTLYVRAAGAWAPVEVTGGSIQLLDDQALEIGTDDDVSLTYVSAVNALRMWGKALVAAGASPATAAMSLLTGDRTTNNAVVGNGSGALVLGTGVTDSTNAGGTGGASGDVLVASGNATSTLGTSGATGSVTVESGDSTDAASGNVVLQTGTAGTTKGVIQIQDRSTHPDDIIEQFGTGNDAGIQYLNGTNSFEVASTDFTGTGAGLATPTANIILESGDRIVTDAAAGTDSGDVTIGSGDTDSTNAGGTGGDTGDVTVQSGNADSLAGTSGDSGNVLVQSGFSDDANSGNVTIQSGNASVDAGDIIMQPGAGGGTDGQIIMNDADDPTRQVHYMMNLIGAAQNRAFIHANQDVDMTDVIKSCMPLAALGVWLEDGDGAETNGAGLVGATPLLTAAANAYAVADDGGALLLLSNTAAGGGYGANWQIFPNVPANNDACYFGADIRFCELAFNMSVIVQTYGAPGAAITWEYSQGAAAWATLMPAISWDGSDAVGANDGQNSFGRDGAIAFEPPALWATDTINGQLAFWVRARVTTQANFAISGVTQATNHEIVTPNDGWYAPCDGTIIGIRAVDGNIVGVHANAVNFMLMNYNTGLHSGNLQWGAAQRSDRWGALTLAINLGDRLGAVVLNDNGGANEITNAILELEVRKTS